MALFFGFVFICFAFQTSNRVFCMVLNMGSKYEPHHSGLLCHNSVVVTLDHNNDVHVTGYGIHPSYCFHYFNTNMLRFKL